MLKLPQFFKQSEQALQHHTIKYLMKYICISGDKSVVSLK